VPVANEFLGYFGCVCQLYCCPFDFCLCLAVLCGSIIYAVCA
jgi:hypothetical protein